MIGALLGVILGWFLNYISTKGEIKIFIEQFSFYIALKPVNGISETQSIITKQTETVTLKMQMDVYNSSNEQAIMRDLSFLINKHEISNSRKLYLLEKNEHSFIPDSKEFRNINIPPKTLLSFNSYVYFEKSDFSQLKKSDFQIQYKNNRAHIKLKRIKHNWPIAGTRPDA